MPSLLPLALAVLLVPAQQADPAALVPQLGDDSVVVRERAQAELLKLGLA